MFKSPLYSAMTDETSVALLLINFKHACDNNFVDKAVDSFTLQGLMEFIRGVTEQSRDDYNKQGNLG